MERTKTTRRQWRAGVGIVVLALVVVAIWREWPRERLLMEVARPIVKVNPWKEEVCWLSAHQVLLVMKDTEATQARNKNGAFLTTPWRGSADLVNIDVGVRTRLSGLTDLLRRTVLFPKVLPCGFNISPDGEWLQWVMLEDAANVLPTPCAARLDGTHYRTWTCTDAQPGLYLGSNHLAQLKTEEPRLIVRDLMDPSQDRYYNGLKQSRVALGSYALHQPGFTLSPDARDTPMSGLTELDTYNMQDQLEFLLQRPDNPFTDPPAPVAKHYVMLPEGAQPAEVRISPQQTSVFYCMEVDRTPPLLAWLHRFLPALVKTRLLSKGLWVSRIDGKGLREIGSAPISLDAKGQPDHFAFNYFKWLPDSRHISFIYRDTLYVVPAEPGK